MEKNCINVGPYIFKIHKFGALYYFEIYTWDDQIKLFDAPVPKEFLKHFELTCTDLRWWGISNGIEFPLASSKGEKYTLYLGDRCSGPSDDSFTHAELVIVNDDTCTEVVKAMLSMDQIFNIEVLIDAVLKE